MSPLVSVVMGVYNGEKFLRNSVDSMLNQTFHDFEFIIINDGSIDKTKEILESYHDNRIILIHQENIGLTKSLNKGISLAKGKYIARQDADDFSMPDRLDTQVAFLSSNPTVSMVGTAVNVIDSQGNTLATFRAPCDFEIIKKDIRQHNCFWHGSVMFVRDWARQIGGYREDFTTAQDYDLWLRFAENYSLANLATPLYAYRFCSDSITFSKIVSQHRMAALARRLADARENGIPEERILTCIDSFLSKALSRQERQEIITNYKPWVRLLLKHNMLHDAKKLMSELFKYHPNALFKLAYRIGKNVHSHSILSRFIEHA